MAKLSPLNVVPLLPGTNCKECGEETCMSFAVKLLDHLLELESCKPLFTDKKFAKKLKKLKDLVAPPVKLVKIGAGDNQIKIGGEEVLYRHELTYYNPTAIFIDVNDEDLDDLEQRVKFVNDYKVIRLGGTFELQGIAVRSISGNPDTFMTAVKKIQSMTKKPLILCTLDPKVMEAGLKAAKNKNPLIYGATKDNWKEMGNLSITYKVPIAVLSTDLDELKSICVSLENAGIEQIVLDPGTIPGTGHISATYDRHMMLKKAAIEKNDKSIGYPTIGVPASVWANKNIKDLSLGEKISLAYEEGKIGALFISHATNLVIFHTADNWFELAMCVVRQNVYSDPRINPSVDAGLIAINDPTPESPLFVTTNYTMTYFVVKGDLEDNRIPSWLLVVDTEGISVECAVAGGQMNAQSIAEAMDKFKVRDKIKHHVVIIPGLAARISGELEDTANAIVLVGPRDCGGIPDLLKKKWDLGKLEEQWKQMQQA
ncbi:MAG: acetyl-CoA decarbonylase/synthase complex subunit gamma [Candidatus Helarchaeota archaeon]